MIRIALIGRAAAQDYTTVANRLFNMRFAAIVDRDLGAAQDIANVLRAPIATASADVLLAQHIGEFDAAVLLDAEDLQMGLVEQLAQAGKHLLVSWSIASSVQAATHLVDRCRSAGVRLMVAGSLRFMPSQQAMKTTLGTGKLGDLGLMRFHRWQPHRPSDNGESILMQQCTHGIDLAIWFFQTLPTQVYAAGNPQYAQVHLGFLHGGMALIDNAQTLPQGDSYFSLSLIGSTGAAYADDHHNRNLVFQGGDPRAIDTGQGDSHLTEELQEFGAAIEAGREPAVTGDDVRAALQVAEAAAASLKSQRSLQLIGGSYELA